MEIINNKDKFHVREVLNDLKKELKENYKGLWSVAVCLINRYFHYHNNPEEYM